MDPQVETDAEEPAARKQARGRMFSYYGLALAKSSQARVPEGARFCEIAIQKEPYQAEHYVILARIWQADATGSRPSRPSTAASRRSRTARSSSRSAARSAGGRQGDRLPPARPPGERHARQDAPQEAEVEPVPRRPNLTGRAGQRTTPRARRARRRWRTPGSSGPRR